MMQDWRTFTQNQLLFPSMQHNNETARVDHIERRDVRKVEVLVNALEM